MNYYVYYKVDPQRVAEVRSLVESLFSEIEQHCGVRGRWMRRRDDPSTYMEVYEGVRDAVAFEALISRVGARLGVPRKLEVFVCA